MGTFSIWHWLIVLAVALLLFGGGGKIKKIMGDLGSGVTAFKKGLKDEDKNKDKEDPSSLERSADDTADAAEASDKDKAASG